MTLSDWAGWLPAIILPGSTALQLWRIWRSRSSESVSILSWILFCIANLGAYFMAPDNYADIRAILAFLLSAVLDVIIVLLAWQYRRNPPAKAAGYNADSQP